MKILLISIGTRGDIEPFLAIGELLHKKGHEILFSFPEQFTNLVPNYAKFLPLSSQFIELLESEDGKSMMGGGEIGLISKAKALYKLYKEGYRINKILFKQQYHFIKEENPDRIIHNSKANYPLIWSIENSKETVMVSPVPYFMYFVKGNAHIGFNGNYGTIINKFTYRLANFGLIKTIKDATSHIPTNSILSRNKIKKALFSEKLVFAISPTLFSKPDYWPSNAQVLGYHERDKKTNWKPTKEIVSFLEKNEKVLFLTFGSMINLNPKKTSHLFFETLNNLKVPTIVNTASGGLMKLDEFADNKLFYFVNSIPYDWILKRVYGVIHHGGSGTTHMGLKNGCPTLIIPHIIDQFGWNNLVSELNVGPKGVSINKVSKGRIETLVTDLISNKSYKLEAEKIAEKMRKDNFKEKICEFILD